LAWAVQKLSELGVDALSLIETERTIRFPPGAEERRRLSERLRSIAREGAMQSRRPFIMEIGEFHGLREALQIPGGLTVVLHEGGSLSLSQVPDDIAHVTLFVGPEGGFADREIEDAHLAGASLASLGRGILRTETAAVVGAALLLARFGRLG
jgi:16S rRNA (uracil1498-N3)-methyltransferase